MLPVTHITHGPSWDQASYIWTTWWDSSIWIVSCKHITLDCL